MAIARMIQHKLNDYNHFQMITIILKWLKSWKIIKFWNFFFVLLWLFLSLTQPGSFHPSRPSGHCPCHWGHCLQSWIWWRTGPPPQLWGCMSLTWFSLRVWWGESSREEGGVAKGFEFPESSWALQNVSDIRKTPWATNQELMSNPDIVLT